MKKKQYKDFQKVKLKVGKRLPRGQNETNTSFKSKKICIERKHAPQLPTDTSLKEMLKALYSRDVNIKYDNLRKLVKYVSNNKDTLPMYFPEILKELNRSLQDNDGKVRGEAIELIGQCVDNLTEVQFKSFFAPLTLFLKCMMTRNTPMQLDSLKLLDKLLNSHPKVTCRCTHILTNLLNMISRVPHGDSMKGDSRGRILVDVINKTITSEEWRMKVLTRMQNFMQAITTDESENDIADDKEIYWNGEEPLFLPLYSDSGTVPAKLDYFWCNQDNADSDIMKQFIFDLAPILVAILKGDILLSAENISEFHIVKYRTIKSLHTITQLLVSIAELAHQISHKEGNMDLLTSQKFFVPLNTICYELLKGFPYVPHNSCGKIFSKTDETECMQLNIALCYLYCKLILKTTYADFDVEAQIHSYLMTVFRFSGTLSDKSVTLILRTIKNILQCQRTGELFRDGVLVGLIVLLDKNKLEPLADKLDSFFMDLTMNYDFKYLLNSNGMKIWFNNLFKCLTYMMELKKVSKKMLKYIEQVCLRRYPHFIKRLNSMPTDKLLEFLRFDDETFQWTIIHLITSLDFISPDFLRDIAATITEKNFSLKSASRMVCFLNCRYSKPNISAMDQLHFVKFLLNVGCDAFFGVKPPPKFVELLPLHDSLLDAEQNCLCANEVYPLSTSKKYVELFEVCFRCMLPYIKNKFVVHSVFNFVKSFCLHSTKFPVHSVIAIMEIRKSFSFFGQDKQLYLSINEMCFTASIYMSLVTNAVPMENWDDYLLPKLQNSLTFLEPKAMMQKIEEKYTKYGKGEMYLLLKVVNYIFKTTNIMSRDKNSAYEFLDKLGASCREHPTITKMWMDLCKMA